MKVKVQNTSERVVERLGYFFQPKQEQEIEISHPRHHSLLEACQYLQVEEIKEKKKAVRQGD
ncbi:hypothetical protein MK805_15320 [Shimazuella sp. AN120528]|uniref:hypothetical protein n=1 Tax=Shimazuella soli TaxID=1892854 RepID=UPI001F0D3A87|nr:hypothetical protein [Shimazuella soli]MCH5586312.1 hypothetical protein [Shimazuella soli]